MPLFGPISRRALIHCLRDLRFIGPFAGGRHGFMQKGRLKVHLPNAHRGGISPPLLDEILKQAGISRDEWERI
ncbi:MAG: hypothetical protein HY691_06270 [Chloroflexi bacterium]|nr:hypothetical protein [Chloroflexota bacterium]